MQSVVRTRASNGSERRGATKARGGGAIKRQQCMGIVTCSEVFGWVLRFRVTVLLFYAPFKVSRRLSDDTGDALVELI